jgi:hypothetical protein
MSLEKCDVDSLKTKGAQTEIRLRTIECNSQSPKGAFYFINCIDLDDGVRWNIIDNTSTGNSWLRLSEQTQQV